MIITVTSFKGGVGKSTTAIHLAACLATKRNKTVLADGDLNRSVISWYERGGESLPFTVCDGDSVPADYDHLGTYRNHDRHISRRTYQNIRTYKGVGISITYD